MVLGGDKQNRNKKEESILLSAATARQLSEMDGEQRETERDGASHLNAVVDCL